MNFFDHKDLGNHLLQLRPKVVEHSVYIHMDPALDLRNCGERRYMNSFTSWSNRKVTDA